MPFQKELDPQYETLTAVIRAEGYHPIRLDRDLYAGDVRETVVVCCGDWMRSLRRLDAKPERDVRSRPGARIRTQAPVALARTSGRARGASVLFATTAHRDRIGIALAEALKTYLAEARSGR
jgi:hypothetical protein